MKSSAATPGSNAAAATAVGLLAALYAVPLLTLAWTWAAWGRGWLPWAVAVGAVGVALWRLRGSGRTPGNGAGDPAAWLFLAPGLALRAAGHLTGEWTLTWLSLPLVLVGLAGTLRGRETRRALLPAAAVLLLAVPMPGVLSFELTYRLKGLVATGAAGLLDVCGIPVEQRAWTLRVGSGGAWRELQVVDACSGARAQVGLLAVITLLLALRPRSRGRRFGMLAACVPAALAASILRVATMGSVYHFGPPPPFKGMIDFYHDLSGALVVVPGVLLVLAVDRAIAAFEEARHAA